MLYAVTPLDEGEVLFYGYVCFQHLLLALEQSGYTLLASCSACTDGETYSVEY